MYLTVKNSSSSQLHRKCITNQYTMPSFSAILYRPIRDLLTSECCNLLVDTCSNYIQNPTFQDHYKKHVLFSAHDSKYDQQKILTNMKK